MMASQPVELTSITLQTAVGVRENGGSVAKVEKTRKQQLKLRREKLTHLEENSGRARMFGVTCNFGTDDFFFLPLIGIAIRATWLTYCIAVCVYAFVSLNSPSCSDLEVPLLMTVSLFGLLSLNLLTIALYVLTSILSSRGSLIRHKPRAKVVVAAYILILVALVELGWLVFSSFSAATLPVVVDFGSFVVVNTTVDPSAAELLMSSGSGAGGNGSELVSIGLLCPAYGTAGFLFILLVAAAWLVYFAILLSFLFLLDPCGLCLGSSLVTRIAKTQKYHKEDYDEVAEKPLNEFDKFDSVKGRYSNSVGLSTLSTKLRETFCCCVRRDGLKNSRAEALSDVVQALRILFSDLDVTFSDLLAGFLLASLYQRRLKAADKDVDHELTEATVKLLKEKDYIMADYTTPSPRALTSTEFKKLGSELNYYFKYCVAAYGCPVHIYLNPLTGPFSLCIAAKGCCCCCNMCQLEQFEGDTCYPNTAAIKEIAGVYPEEIITASFINSVYKVPYYVVYEADSKRLIVAIRGTLSLQDALTDVSVSMWEIPDGLLGVKPAYVHKGFYESALVMYKALIERSRFQSILNENGVEEFVITGHSLGAAVAAVLAVLFKDRHGDAPWINCLRAITFSTPGAIMSYSLAEKTTNFVTSVIGGNDLVPRMTMRSLGYLKMLVTTMLVTVDHPKHQVLCCSGQGRAQCCNPRVLEEEDILGLAYSEEELNSVNNLDLAGDTDASFKKLKTYLPFLDKTWTLDPAWKKEGTKEVVRKFAQELDLVKGGARERDENPAMFLPGRILHLEDSKDYGENQFCGLKKRRKVIARWKSREAISTILVHKDMLLDHTPHRMVSMLERFQHYPDNTPIPHQEDHPSNNGGPARERVFTA